MPPSLPVRAATALCPLRQRLDACAKRSLQPFIVLALARTGTHHLADRLNAHPLLYHHSEELYKMPHATYHEWCTSVGEYLNTACTAAPDGARAAGGVMMLGHLPAGEKATPPPETGSLAELNAIEMVLRRPLSDAMAMSALAGSVPVILYRRRNLVRTCVSKLFHRSQSHMFGTQHADKLRSLQQRLLSTTAVELLDCVGLEAAGQARYARMVAAPELVADLRWMTIVYEDLLGGAQAEELHADRTASFLVPNQAAKEAAKEAPPSRVSGASPMLRIHVGSIMRYLDANVTEVALRAAFDGTAWEWMLIEALSVPQGNPHRPN